VKHFHGVSSGSSQVYWLKSYIGKARVYLVGDYDKSNLYEKAQAEYQNIAEEFVKEYNEFIRIDDRKLEVETA
jgi:hypothetical protein